MKRIIMFWILAVSSLLCNAENGLYIGAGLNNLELDSDNSINLSMTAGYDLKKWTFNPTRVQSLKLSVETQYSNSISGNSGANNYSVFAALRAYTSDQWFLKAKQGITDFPDITLQKPDAENSHIGAGIGLGYQIDSGSIEIEYVVPNKSIGAALFEISYKYQF